MKDKNIKTLIDKYEAGQSSIDEEKIIIDAVKDSNSNDNQWFKFLKQQSTKVPVDFNEKLWEKFDDKTQSKRKLIISILSTAAAVLLFATLYFGGNQQEGMSYKEKAALLNQAIEMTSNQEQDIAKQDILYEDQTIIIYTKTVKK
jgi:GTP-binding protein EngB required for normal cell division